jgi:hypothetical protein
MIPVIWHAQEEGRGRYNCTAMLNDMFDFFDCTHYGGAKQMPDVEGAVVVVHGGREPFRLDAVNYDISGLKWVLLIFLGDEECTFPAELVNHPNKRVWVQEPMPGRHDFAERFILNGYSHDHMRYVTACPKDLDWFFAGQVTHERRRACVTALQSIDWGGVIIETKGFCQGISRSEYFQMMCRARIVPCPSGPFSQDAARPWEALECGAIPILDDLSPTRKEPGFWKYLLGRHPFPVVTDWSTLPALIEKMKKDNLDILARECANWWWAYKVGMRESFKYTIEELTCSKI